MRKKLIVICFFFSTCIFSQSVWVEQQSGFGNNHYIQSVYFFNANTGFLAGGSGTFAKTTNGGMNWIIIPNNNNNHWEDIFFLNENTGWIAGAFYDYSISWNTIRKTTTGGLTWDSIYFSPNNRINKIWFVNNSTGFISDLKSLNKSTNGGLNWYLIDSSNIFQKYYKALFFINEQTGWTSRYDTVSKATKILKTTNCGLGWFEQFIDTSTTSNIIFDIRFVNAQTGFAVGAGIYKTTNSGLIWNNLTDNSYHYKVFFINQSTGWVGKWNYVCKTTNCGLNWVSEFIMQGCYFRGLSFINENTGWTGGMTNVSSPKIYKTTVGGVSFINPISEVVPSSFSLSQNYPNPFNPTTIIRFQIKDSKTTTLKIFDLLGREVQTLVNEKLKPGEYEVTFDGSNFPSGVYFYKLQAGDFTDTKKLVLIK